MKATWGFIQQGSIFLDPSLTDKDLKERGYGFVPQNNIREEAQMTYSESMLARMEHVLAQRELSRIQRNVTLGLMTANEIVMDIKAYASLKKIYIRPVYTDPKDEEVYLSGLAQVSNKNNNQGDGKMSKVKIVNSIQWNGKNFKDMCAFSNRLTFSMDGENLLVYIGGTKRVLEKGGYLFREADGSLDTLDEKAYKHQTELINFKHSFDFSEALKILKAGGRIVPLTWLNKDRYIEIRKEISRIPARSFIALCSTFGGMEEWHFDQKDLLTEKWFKFEDKTEPELELKEWTCGFCSCVNIVGQPCMCCGTSPKV